MRRRQHQHQQALMTEPDMDPMTIEADVESGEEEMLIMSAFDIATGDDDRKAFSIWPRNYTGRRRVVITGVCLFLAAIVGLKASGSNGGTTMLLV
jgi:hypothetical protein